VVPGSVSALEREAKIERNKKKKAKDLSTFPDFDEVIKLLYVCSILNPVVILR
jgi:hypothetical protein